MVSPAYRPDPRHETLGGEFFDAVQPANFPQAILRFRNDRWAARVGLVTLDDAAWVRHFARFDALPGNLAEPLALRYHGDQFRHYNPDLGDGRGFLFAQVRDAADGRLLDLATKGSGQTPWSRQGDGRLTLKGGVREILATEMLEALGVYTSKSFSLVETGEPLHRGDEPSPTRSSVLVRLGHSHVRFGTFQRLAYLGKDAELRRLVDYTIETYWPASADAADPVAAMFASIVRAVAQMAAEWYAAGFVHGVLNTDNTVVTGESFDYGPWRFLPHLDVEFTAAYFDHSGLYAFGRQPGAILWNLQRLAACLLAMTSEDKLIGELNRFAPEFEARLREMTLARLGMGAGVGADGTSKDLSETVIRPLYSAMHETKVPFQRAFFDLFAGARPERLRQSPHAALYDHASWSAPLQALRNLEPSLPATEAFSGSFFAGAGPVAMIYEDVETIWNAIDRDDDWSAFARMVDDIRRMGAAYRLLLPARAGHAPIGDGIG